MGLFTVGAFGFFGMMFRVDRPLLGYALLGLCGFRAVLWVREVYYFFTPEPEPEREPEPTEP